MSSSVWEKLTSSYRGGGDMVGGEVVIVSCGGSGGAVKILTSDDNDDNNIDKYENRVPLGYRTMDKGEVGVWCVDVGEDGRGLMESVVLREGTARKQVR